MFYIFIWIYNRSSARYEDKMEGLITKEEKPSNTEVLGLLIDKAKLRFITKLNSTNLKGLCKLSYITKRLQKPNRDAVEIHEEVIEEYLTLKTAVVDKKGNRADQVVDALKHIIDDENKDMTESIAQQIRS